MPTYQNRSGQMVTVGDWSFSPGEKKQVNQYINIVDHPNIFKISEDPDIANDWAIIFSNLEMTSNMSRFIHGRISLVVSIRDVTGCSDGDVIELVAFSGITDRVNEMVPVKTFTFTRKTCKDENGNATPYWFPKDGFRLSQQLIDSNYEMIAFQVTSFTGDGKVNVLIKSY